MEGAELAEFKSHLRECTKCHSDYQEFSRLVTRELPQGQSTLQQKLQAMRTKPLRNSRQRFIRRAGAEGLDFSRDVEIVISRGC